MFPSFPLAPPYADVLPGDSVPEIKANYSLILPFFPRQVSQCMLESKVTNRVFGYKNIGGRILQVVVAFGGIRGCSPRPPIWSGDQKARM